jgi:putative transcriptional regulator
LPIADDICLTATLDILRAIAKGDGPQKAVLALGYAGWSSGQLESEILANGWLHCPADANLVFDNDFQTKYERAMAKIGVSLAMLSGEAGRA